MSNGELLKDKLPYGKCDHVGHMIGYDGYHNAVCDGCGARITRPMLIAMSLKNIAHMENRLREIKGEQVIGI